MAASNTTVERLDPFGAFCFSVTISIGVEGSRAFFKSVSGLSYETEVVDYREGGVNWTTRKLVGATKWPNLVLKRGFTKSYELLRWREAWLNDSPNARLERANGVIAQLDSRYQAVCTWKFERAWPCKWEGPEYDASKSELAIETLEIAHEGLVFSVAGS